VNVIDVRGNWDKFRLEQIVTNLMTNAARYGSGKPVEVHVTAGDDTAKIVVKDHGRGIPPEDQEKIFLRFERSASAADIRGLGLGLFISRQIAEMHRGQITVESEPGKGSTFTVTLPLKDLSHV
jgi:signal transduction histidine kinase